MAVWLKNPLAILADDSDGGIVVEGTSIVELVPAGKSPTVVPANDLQIFDASQHVLLP
ncbi:MAG: 8-oxoguanine deaminase, partial [Pseudomonas marincola]